MKKALLLSCVVVSAATFAACGQPAAPPAPAPTPLGSGIEVANLDKTVRAQDDFYKHVNGVWLTKTEIPAEKPGYGAFDELADGAEKNVHDLIEAAAKDPNRPAGAVAQQVGDLFASFMNEAKAEQLGVTAIRTHLDEIAAIKTLADVARVSGGLSAINIGGPSNQFIEPDAKNPSANIVTFVQAGTSLPEREYYLSKDAKYVEIRAKYVEYLTKILGLVGRPTAAADAKAILAFETEMARVQWTPAESRDAIKTYNKVAVAKFNAEYPGFDWATWMKVQGLDKAPDAVVAQPSFMKGISALAAKTPVDTWKAWLSAQVVISEARLLSKAFVDANFEFFAKTLNGQQAQRPRWKRGVTLVNGSLGEAVGKLYVDKYFPPEAKARMETMIANLLEAYKQSITSLDWMTPETKKEALAKLAKFTTKIGYPDKFRSYAGLVIKTDDLVGNAERANRFENDFQIAKLGKPVDRGLWLMTPQEVNAYYNPVQNEIVFPAAILQPPFFNFKADDAVNYGGIGAVIGHEIGHGFDDQGRHYDGDGKLRDWWTKADATEFDKRAKMLTAQFNAFEPLPGLHVNGQLTLGENIGDLGGLSIAFKAYKIALAGKPSTTIDGFTGEQRVFMGWTQAWREKFRDEFLRVIVTSNEHAPSMYRGGNPLTNIDAFYDAFGVKAGDKMFRKPEERVRIW
ncbi:MAG: M13-type metalloendopeptidase [Acidobacteriota bacterium]